MRIQCSYFFIFVLLVARLVTANIWYWCNGHTHLFNVMGTARSRQVHCIFKNSHIDWAEQSNKNTIARGSTACCPCHVCPRWLASWFTYVLGKGWSWRMQHPLFDRLVYRISKDDWDIVSVTLLGNHNFGEVLSPQKSSVPNHRKHKNSAVKNSAVLDEKRFCACYINIKSCSNQSRTWKFEN